MSAAIEVRGLRKDYRAGLGGREVKALSGIDFAVQPGELFGLLGPNGAGKTTTVKILLGLTHATAGSAALLGKSVADPESRRRVGYLPEGHRFPGYLTARQTLSIFGRMSGVAPRGPEGAHPGAPSQREAFRVDGREGEEVLQGHDAASRPRGRARARARSAPPRRADGRRRPRGPARDPRPAEGRGGEGARDSPELAPPFRDRAHVRPRRGAPQRPRRGDGDDRRIDEEREKEGILRRCIAWWRRP